MKRGFHDSLPTWFILGILQIRVPSVSSRDCQTSGVPPQPTPSSTQHVPYWAYYKFGHHLFLVGIAIPLECRRSLLHHPPIQLGVPTMAVVRRNASVGCTLCPLLRHRIGDPRGFVSVATSSGIHSSMCKLTEPTQTQFETRFDN